MTNNRQVVLACVYAAILLAICYGLLRYLRVIITEDEEMAALAALLHVIGLLSIAAMLGVCAAIAGWKLAKLTLRRWPELFRHSKERPPA